MTLSISDVLLFVAYPQEILFIAYIAQILLLFFHYETSKVFSIHITYWSNRLTLKRERHI